MSKTRLCFRPVFKFYVCGSLNFIKVLLAASKTLGGSKVFIFIIYLRGFFYVHADALLFFMLRIKLSANGQGKLRAVSAFSNF